MTYLNWLSLLSVTFDCVRNIVSQKNGPKSEEKTPSPFTNKEQDTERWQLLLFDLLIANSWKSVNCANKPDLNGG